MKTTCKIAMFRLMVIGQLISRHHLARGELGRLTQALSRQTYQHPNGREVSLSPRTIERWYYDWRRDGLDGLVAKPRKDKGASKLSKKQQEALIAAKQDNPTRSIDHLLRHLQLKGELTDGEVSRSSVHRLLKRHGLSKRDIPSMEKTERRSFEAYYAGDIWYGDVMHGPYIHTSNGVKKTYLVSLMDDASRLICHSAFHYNENALAIEHVLKQAILKRGLPKKLVVDNGSAYRSNDLSWTCASLGIQFIYCRPYTPEGKGKLERWHRTCREQFLTEIEFDRIINLSDINSRLWVWIEKIYHQTKHHAFSPLITPIERWQRDLVHIRQLNSLSKPIDEYFYHRIKRYVRKDGTISWENRRYEVAHTCSGQDIILIYCGHDDKLIRAESLDGENLGEIVPLDKHANLNRRRQQAMQYKASKPNPKTKTVELALEELSKQAGLPNFDEE